ncbi:siderophore-interacting protein [Oerskovia sp. NPDC060287]|uniref:siderophore-interacting protein n=1 Tax=Oerskovia sp. NPDC060287 TaxID=3347095 RepID=UPI003661C42E
MSSPCFPARVVTATRITPHMVRVHLEAVGDWRWTTDGQGDERIDLAFPFPGETVAEIAFFNQDDYGVVPVEGTEPPWRHYTARRVHDAGRTIVVDLAVHDGGLASDWAVRAEPGHVLGVFAGGDSRSYYDAPDDAEWRLLVADPTGLPGLGRIVEELPAGAVAHAVVEVPTLEDRQQLETRGDVTYTWLVTAEGARTGAALVEAVRGLSVRTTPGYAWVACESAASRDVRRTLRTAWGMPRDRHQVVGYWTAGAVNVRADRDDEDAQPHEHDHEHDHAEPAHQH